MFEMFTDRARKVVQYAKESAYQHNFEYAGTEHILIGLLREPDGVAHHVLESLNVSIGRIHTEIEKIMVKSDSEVDRNKVIFSQRANKVINNAIDEANLLGHKYVGTEHLLLGLLKDEESVAAQILLNLEVNVKDTRVAVLDLLEFPGLNIKDASNKLHSQLKNNTCYITLGIGDNEIIVYTKNKRKQDLFKFEGFNIRYIHMGNISP